MLISEDLSAFTNVSFIDWTALDGHVILVTGASGLIGSACVNVLLRRNEQQGCGTQVLAVVRNLEKAQNKFSGFLTRDDFRIITVDILNQIFVDGAVDYIIHCAGVTGNPRLFVEKPFEVLNTAFLGTMNVLELARKKAALGVVFLSSWEVYGTPSEDVGMIDESYSGHIDLENVRTSYKESKRIAEQLCIAYASEFCVPAKIARISITSGPGFDESDKRFLPQFVRMAVSGSDIVLKSTGETVRSHVYLYDCVTALLTILLHGKIGHAYNIANRDAVFSVAEIALKIAHDCDVNVVFDLKEDNATMGHNGTIRAVLNTARLEALGWRPLVPFCEMLKIMEEYAREKI